MLLRPFAIADGRWRLSATLADVDPLFVETLIAYEDRRFREHGGVDVRALLRAAWQFVRYGRPVSGASTLTMQVARLLTGDSTRSVGGKLQQILTALRLEQALSKDEILEPLPRCSRPMAATSKACAPPRSPISARSRAG